MNDQIPTPADVAKRVADRQIKAHQSIRTDVARKLREAVQLPVTVHLPMGEDRIVVRRVITELREIGWTVEQLRGSQQDPDNALVISIPVALADLA